jgi:hypothetical protein
MKTSNGALYIITQDRRYVDMLLTSAASLKEAMPDLPITVFSQFPFNSSFIDNVVIVRPTQDGFYDKARLIADSPYDRTLFIDADTFVLEPVPELFSLLDQFDCAATHEEYLSTDWFARYPRQDIAASFPEFNTGILLVKRSLRTQQLLQQWGDLYQAYLQEKPDQPLNDQPFFRAAVYYSDIRMATLTREYNCKFRGQGYLNKAVKILHGHVDFQLVPDHIRQAATVLNASQKPRVYVAGEVYEQKLVGRLIGRRKASKVGSFPELPGSITWRRAKRLKTLIAERGMRKVLAKVFATS